MKRVREISADDGDVRVVVTVKVETKQRTQYETANILDQLSDHVLTVLPGLTYTDFRMARAKVR